MASRLWRERHQEGLGDYAPVSLSVGPGGGSGSGGGGGGLAALPPRGRGLLLRLFPVPCSRAAAVALVVVAGATAAAALLLLALDGTVVLRGSLPAAPDYETLMARMDSTRAACETYASRSRGAGLGGRRGGGGRGGGEGGGGPDAEVPEGMCAAHGEGGRPSAFRPPPAAFCGGVDACGGVTWGFLVVGDWGRRGACCARDVAAEMSAAVAALGGWRDAERRRRGVAANGSTVADGGGGPPAAVISTGDNFYDAGVASVTDPAVAASWADVYLVHPPLAAVPWRVVVGNHDYEGNISAAFDIGRVHPQWHARRELYYTQSVTLPRAPRAAGGGANGSAAQPPPREVLLVFLDTTPLVTQPDVLRLHYRLRPSELAAVAAAVDGGLTRWLGATLRASTADWVVVVGHHPIESAGASSVAEAATRARLRGMVAAPLEAAAARRVGGAGRGGSPDGVVYFSGHEHDVQHTVVGGVHYVVSGGGSLTEASPQRQPGTLFSVAVHAFWGAVVTDEVLSLQVVDYAGRFLYQTVVRPRNVG